MNTFNRTKALGDSVKPSILGVSYRTRPYKHNAKNCIVHGLLVLLPSTANHILSEFKPTHMQQLQSGRIASIDVLRGATILTMTFVNELAGVTDVPQWMKHMAADADAMSFVDIIFPSFLFIVGMSIPFALQSKIAKRIGAIAIIRSIAVRFLGLLIVGVFMVNSDSGFYTPVETSKQMVLSIGLWSVLMYLVVIATWTDYAKWNLSNRSALSIKAIGFIFLFVLYLLYRNKDGGTMEIQWWGILGLIGWAYLIGCLSYWFTKGNLYLLVALILAFTGVYVASKAAGLPEWLQWISSTTGHLNHAGITISGIVLSLIFFKKEASPSLTKRYGKATLFIAMLVILGYFLRANYTISKIWATPTWCFYSVAICSLLFMALYFIVEQKGIKKWTSILNPAAENPLLIYLLPYLLSAASFAFGFSYRPAYFNSGTPGILWSIGFAISFMFVVQLLNKKKIYLKL